MDDSNWRQEPQGGDYQVVAPLTRVAERLPASFPLPVRQVLPYDTNVLRNEVLRRARRLHEQPSRALVGARAGTVLLVAPCHVIAEMDRDLPEFATRAGVDFGMATAAWNEYRPLFTSVDVRDLLDYLGGHPLVAPTLARHNVDGSTAVLSALLGVRVMSEDGDLQQVASGRAWLSHVIAATDAGRADSVTYAASWGGTVTGIGVIKGAQRAYGALSAGTSPLVANCAAGLAALLLLVLSFHEPTRRRVLESRPVMALRSGLSPAVDEFVRISNLGVEGHAYLRSVALPDLEQLDLVARLARRLAESPRPLTAPELAVHSKAQGGLVAHILDGLQCFQPTGDGRWRLGSSVTV